MKNIQHFDNLIIGFGKGGKTLAAWLAKQGQQVALIETSEKMYGGSCINIACIPSKSLIVSGEKELPYPTAYKEKKELTALLREKNFKNLNELPSVTIITGHASFVSANEVSVITAGNEQISIQARRIFINTGSKPFIPDIPGINISKKVFTSASLMEQPVLAEKLVIIGGGFIGLEFAGMYAKFGAQVTILDRSDTFLPHEDEDIAAEIFKVLTAKNINIISKASVQEIADTNRDTVNVRYKNKDSVVVNLEASAILIATGRRANVDGLNLSAAGIQTNSKGYVAVDELLKTHVSHIWAIGDVNGGPQFTYISLDDFRIIRDQLSGGPYTSVTKRKQVAFTVFITPPLAHIGLREKVAIEKGYTIKVAKLPAAAIPRARILNNTDGLLKTIVDAGTHKILGCTLFCVDAHEMINTVQTAMNAELEYQVVRDAIYTHPSMTEAFNDLYSLIN